MMDHVWKTVMTDRILTTYNTEVLSTTTTSSNIYFYIATVLSGEMAEVFYVFQYIWIYVSHKLSFRVTFLRLNRSATHKILNSSILRFQLKDTESWIINRIHIIIQNH